jgi:hypothetical protein
LSDRDIRDHFINVIDSILEIQFEELSSDKEEVIASKNLSLANRRSFRYGMYATVGLAVTSLIGLGEVGILNTIHQRIILFVIAGVIGIGIFLLFGKYLSNLKYSARIVEEKYNKAIYFVNYLRVIYKCLEMNRYEISDLDPIMISSFNSICLRECRRQISDTIEEVLKERYLGILLFRKDFNQLLSYKKDRQDKLIQYADNMKNLISNNFKKKNELLEGIKGLLPPEMCQKDL